MEIKFQGNPVQTIGSLPKVGMEAKPFTLVKTDLSAITLQDFRNKNLILNIFLSIDTPVCSKSVQKFNQEASKLENTKILSVAMDLPFAFKRFCAAQNIDNVETGSAFRNPEFGKDYGVTIIDGPLQQLLSRAIVVIDAEGKIIYTEQVPEISHEPNYEAALQSLR